MNKNKTVTMKIYPISMKASWHGNLSPRKSHGVTRRLAFFSFSSSLCFGKFCCTGCSQSWDTVSRTRILIGLGLYYHHRFYLSILYKQLAATASSSALTVVSEGSELFSILPFSLSHSPMAINLHLASLGCINQTG